MQNITIAQNVILVVVDGARYTETFGADDPSLLIPYLYNDLMPQGTLYSNFYNVGKTRTNSGHSTLLTGTWQNIANNGTERPTQPTVFEYFRKEDSSSLLENFVIAGKSKLNILTYSTDSLYGSAYMASDTSDDLTDDEVYLNLTSTMDTYNPKLIIVNFPDVDNAGHSGDWDDYLDAITNVDSLIFKLWNKIQNDSYYQNNTTLFITNDHGRHSYDFTEHGDDCEGCQHIMLLALGERISAETIVSDTLYQVDIAPTIGNLMSFSTPNATGSILPIQLEIDINVYLEGPYNNDTMSSAIYSYIPLAQPFSTSPWNYSGSEEVSEIPENVVDWVLVELRNDMNVQSETIRAVFLLSSGKIVDTDGYSSLSFTASPNDYYIVVKHRNHLPIMSNSAITIN